MEVARLVLRQDAGSEAETIPTCEGSNGYDGRMGVRISSIFVILVGSLWGKSYSFAVHHALRCLLWMNISHHTLHNLTYSPSLLSLHLYYISVTNIHKALSFLHSPSVREQSLFLHGPSSWLSTLDPESSSPQHSSICSLLPMKHSVTRVLSVRPSPRTPTHGLRRLLS